MDSTPQCKTAPTAGLPSFFPPLLLYHLRFRPLEYLASISDDQEMSRLGWAGSPLYYAATPELVSQLLLDPRRFEKGALLQKLEIIIGKGLITLNGEVWKDARRRVQKVFHREALMRQHETIVRHTQNMIERLKASPGTNQPRSRDERVDVQHRIGTVCWRRCRHGRRHGAVAGSDR